PPPRSPLFPYTTLFRSVVARAEIVGRRHPLDGVAALVDVEDVLHGARAGDPEHAPFPQRVEDGLVLLALHAPEAVHPAHVVDTVHVTRPRVALCNAVMILSR